MLNTPYFIRQCSKNEAHSRTCINLHFAVAPVPSERPDGVFIQPPAMADHESDLQDLAKNPVYEVDDQVTVMWDWNVDNYTEYYISLYQVDYHNGPGRIRPGSAEIFHKRDFDPATTTTFFPVRPGEFDLTRSEVFYFYLFQNFTSHRTRGFVSHYFNITVKKVSSSTRPPSPTISISTSTSISSTFTSTAMEHSTSHTALPEPHINDSTNIIPLALGVSLGLGVPLLLVLGALLGLYIVYARRREPPQLVPSVQQQAIAQPEKWEEEPAPRYSFITGPTAATPVELPEDNQRRSELY
ncbi:hypothetical protein CC80DRAFT_509302 [Byssothecium circinans]|uniref:Mid2 domain-containing protein n=1 Tax=Byssothecium circinans TaxID=147558 RepID=A0A6A5TJF2_9PLEO|nr:hypothetical protein CC80DRAFT_509302 [Byssothecium circinans]